MQSAQKAATIFRKKMAGFAKKSQGVLAFSCRCKQLCHDAFFILSLDLDASIDDKAALSLFLHDIRSKKQLRIPSKDINHRVDLNSEMLLLQCLQWAGDKDRSGKERIPCERSLEEKRIVLLPCLYNGIALFPGGEESFAAKEPHTRHPDQANRKG